MGTGSCGLRPVWVLSPRGLTGTALHVAAAVPGIGVVLGFNELLGTGPLRRSERGALPGMAELFDACGESCCEGGFQSSGRVCCELADRGEARGGDLLAVQAAQEFSALRSI